MSTLGSLLVDALGVMALAGFVALAAVDTQDAHTADINAQATPPQGRHARKDSAT